MPRMVLISLLVTILVLIARDYWTACEIQQARQSVIAAERTERINCQAERLWQLNYYPSLARQPHHWFWNDSVGQWAYGSVHPVTDEQIECDHQAQMPYYLRVAAEQDRLDNQYSP